LIPGPYPSVALDKIRKVHGRFFWKKQHNGRNNPTIKTTYDSFHSGTEGSITAKGITSGQKNSPRVTMDKAKKKNFTDDITKRTNPNLSPAKHSPSMKSYSML
jgi:hypothetical protein